MRALLSPSIDTGSELSPTKRLDLLYAQGEERARQDLPGTKAVFVRGVGNVHSRIVFVGEAPGLAEDRLGIPAEAPSVTTIFGRMI